MTQPRIELRMQHHRVEARIQRRRIHARRVAIHPVRHRAIRIVVIAVHARVALHLVAVPALPRRRAAVLHHVAPRGISRVQQQIERQLLIARLRQLLQQIRSAQKTRGQQPVIRLYLRRQLLGHCRAQIVRHKIHVQRQHVARLRIAAFALRLWIIDISELRRPVVRTRNKSIRVHICLRKRRTNLLELCRVLLLFGFTASRVRHLAQQRHIVGPLRGRHQPKLRLTVRRKPVAKRNP